MNRKTLVAILSFLLLSIAQLGAITFGPSGPAPVVFLHGYSGDSSVWNNMIKLLKSDANYTATDLHAYSYYSDSFGNNKNTPIKTVAESLAGEIAELYYDNGMQPVNIVAHSMGGLIVRAMLAYDLIDKECLGKFITLGTPHYGQNLEGDNTMDLAGKQADQMKYGSQFLWELAEAWHFNGKTLPHTLCIAGVYETKNGSKWDGLVHVWSAALGNAPCLYVQKCHAPIVSDSTSTGAFWGSLLLTIASGGGLFPILAGAGLGALTGEANATDAICQCSGGTSDDVYRIIMWYLKYSSVYPQSYLNYSSPPSAITETGGLFYQLVDNYGWPVRFSTSDKKLITDFYDSSTGACVSPTFRDHGAKDTESQPYGVEFIFGTMPAGTYRLSRHATETTRAFQKSDVYVTGGRIAVLRIKPGVTTSFNANGGTVTPEKLTHEGGATYGALPVSTRAKYNFLGWYTAGGTRIYSWSTVPGEDITLYAHWREISYSCYDDDMWEYYETGGDGKWASVAASDAVSGSYVFKSGSIGHNASTWFRRTVSGPGRLTFSWRPSSEAGFDKGVFSVDGTQSAVISGVSNVWTRVVEYVYTSGDHELRWTYTKDNATVKGDDCLYVDNIVWQPEIKVTLDGNGGTVYGSATSATWKYVDEKFGYLTTPVRDGYRFDGWFTARNGGSRVSYDTVFSASLTTLYAHWLEETPLDKAADTDQALTTGGSASWFGQTAVGYRGGNAVRSGALDYGQNNWLELKTSGAGRLRFAWKLDGYQSLSSTYSDALSFLVDGAVTNTIYGKQDWEEKLFYFGSGSHTFRWKFAKNGFSPSGADCAWVDAIEWSPRTHLIFDANGGTIESDVFSGYAGDFFVPMEIPVRTGYTFLGWYTLPEGGELVASAWEAIELKKSCALYAHWGFTTLSASTFSSEYVYLYWGYVTGASTYQIYRSTEDVRPSTPLPLDYTLSWTGYFDYTATPGVSYRYWIEVLDANGDSLGVTESALGRRKVTLSCPTDVIETGAADDVMQLTLEANTSWTAVSDAPWVTLYSASGTGNGEFYALIASNTTVSVRSCTVTVTAGAGTDEPVSISIKVYQDAATTIEPQPEPEPDNGGGTSDGAGGPSSAWTATKAKTLYGAVRTADGELAGVVQLKVAKPNARTKATKLYGSVTLLDGKKRTMKSVSVSLPADKPASVKTSVKGLGTLEIEFGDDGFAGTLGGYTVESAEVGGKWTQTDAAVYLDFGDSPDGSLASLFPNGEPVHAKAGKWTFDKAASVKLANGSLVVDISKKRTNLSGLKLTYTPKTGVFKGSFKLYAIQNGKLKKYTVKVTGVVVGGVGTGVAKLAKPSFTGTVSVE